MGFFTELLEQLSGKIHFYVTVGAKPAAEVIIHDKVITIDVKDPVLAIEAALDEFLKRKPEGKDLFKGIKDEGYKVRVKYLMFEFEL